MRPDFYKLLSNIDPTIRARGRVYQKDGRVSDFRQNEENGIVTISAFVNGSRRYHVSISMNGKGELQECGCNCKAFSDYNGMCKHCAALLYEAINKYRDESSSQYTYQTPSRPAAQNNPRGIPTVGTDPYAQQLINEINSEMNQSDNVLPGSVTLTPMLSFDMSIIGLRFMVGITRKYIVKSIPDFLSNINYKRSYSYGKELTFIHRTEAFDDDSKALLRFINSRVEVRNSYSFLSMAGRDTYSLSGGAFDELFELRRGKNFAMSQKQFIEVAPDGFFTPSVLVKRLPDGAVTLKLAGSIDYFSTNAYIYGIDENAISRCIPFPNQLARLVRTMCKCDTLTFSKRDAEKFFNVVYPQMRDCLKVGGDTDELEQLVPEKMTAEICLDAPDKELISCELRCHYGDEYFAPENGAALAGASVFDVTKKYSIGRGVRRDLLAESSFAAAVAAVFGKNSGEALEIRGDDEIYEFLTERIMQLKGLGEVKISDRLKRMTVAAPPKRVNVGVSLSNGMLKMEINADGTTLEELSGLLSAYREKRRYYRLTDGGFVKLGAELADFDELCDRLELSKKDIASGKLTVPAYRTAYLDGLFSDKPSGIVGVSGDKAFENLAKKLRIAYDGDYQLPDSLESIARPYQISGYKWLRRLEECSLGGILADEMGLGKTLQFIALLLSRSERGLKSPSIVVCPASLVYNWKRELEKFAPSLKARVISGTASRRAELIDEIADGELVITSYDLLKKDIDLYSGKKFGCCAIDEAQYIKNHNTLAAKAVRQIVSEQRFALTGTPIENRLSELWSIFDFLMPGYLYGYTYFRQHLEQPIANGDAAPKEALKRMISPFVLRRLKSDVLTELPQKTVNIIPVELGKRQHELYRAALTVGLADLKKNPKEKSGGSGAGKIKALALLTKLREICCDPSLCYENYEGGSAKVEACMELLLQARESEHRVLVFSQFTSLLELLADAMNREGISYNVIRGSTPKEQRVVIADRFNGGEWDALLISLKAGGTGLNLVGADTVIHFDPWWNLAAETQATDRAHRIGQTRPVEVYKLIASETVEEKVIELQEKKKELAAIVDGGDPAAGLSADELISILEER